MAFRESRSVDRSPGDFYKSMSLNFIGDASLFKNRLSYLSGP